jgi:hypothetical protein
LFTAAQCALIKGKVSHQDGDKESNTEKNKNVEVARKKTMEEKRDYGVPSCDTKEMRIAVKV